MNNTAPYFKVSSNIQRMLQDPSILTKSEKKVWLFIYKCCYHAPHEWVALARSIIGKHIGYCVKTVQRAINALRAKGFLTWRSFYMTETCYINHYKILVPKQIDPTFITACNRKRPKASTKDIYNEEREFNEEYVEQKVLLSINEEYLLMTKSDESLNVNNKPTEVKKYTTFHVPHDRKDLDRYITQYRQCEILYNSLTEKLSKEGPEIEQRIKSLQIDEQSANDRFMAFDDSSKTPEMVIEKFKLMRKIQSISHDRNSLVSVMSVLSVNLSKVKEKISQIWSVMTDIGYENNRDGDRKIPYGYFSWIIKKLKLFGIDSRSLPVIVNEIVYSVRFGSLSRSQSRNGPENPLMKSINIALKLVKLGKWQSPATYCYGNY